MLNLNRLKLSQTKLFLYFLQEVNLLNFFSSVNNKYNNKRQWLLPTASSDLFCLCSFILELLRLFLVENSSIFSNFCFRDLENDDDRFFYPQHLINQETKQKCERRKTSSVINSACACSKPQQMPSYRCHGEFRPPCHGFPPSFYNNHCQCQFFCSMKW